MIEFLGFIIIEIIVGAVLFVFMAGVAICALAVLGVVILTLKTHWLVFSKKFSDSSENS